MYSFYDHCQGVVLAPLPHYIGLTEHKIFERRRRQRLKWFYGPKKELSEGGGVGSLCHKSHAEAPKRVLMDVV